MRPAYNAAGAARIAGVTADVHESGASAAPARARMRRRGSTYPPAECPCARLHPRSMASAQAQPPRFQLAPLCFATAPHGHGTGPRRTPPARAGLPHPPRVRIRYRITTFVFCASFRPNERRAALSCAQNANYARPPANESRASSVPTSRRPAHSRGARAFSPRLRAARPAACAGRRRRGLKAGRRAYSFWTRGRALQPRSAAGPRAPAFTNISLRCAEYCSWINRYLLLPNAPGSGIIVANSRAEAICARRAGNICPRAKRQQWQSRRCRDSERED